MSIPAGDSASLPSAADDLPRIALHLLQATDDTVLVLDRDWRILYLNGRALQDAGMAADKLLGRSIWDAYPALLGTVWETYYRSAMTHQQPIRFEARGVITGRWLEVYCYPAPQLLTIHARNITDRKRVELELRAEQERFHNYMDHSTAVAWMKDEELRFVYVNRTWERRFRKTLVEVRGQTDLDIRPRDVGERLRAHDREVFARGRPMEFEEVVPDADGAARHWQVYKFPFQDASGARFVGGMAVDITDRKLAEQKLQEYARRVTEAQEAERRRIAGELHDEIGQVLTAVRLSLKLVGKHSGPEALPHLEEANAIVGRAIGQVRDLSLDLRPSMLDDLGLLEALKWHAKRVLGTAGLNIAFEDSLHGTRLPSAVESAAFRVAQEALTNVARHANAENVRVTLHRSADQFYLTVIDDGAGFVPAEARRRAAQGKSCGLLGMQERVDLFGGRFIVESNPGAGTIIRASFPLEPTT